MAKIKEDGYPYYRLKIGLSIPKDQFDFIRRRVGGLASFDNAHKPLLFLLVNAYILGAKDAVDYIEEERNDQLVPHNQ